MRLLTAALLTLVISCCTFGQTYTINTLAGNGTAGYSGDTGPATSAQLSYPQGIALDAADNMYIADTYNNRIRKVSNGVIITVAGGGTSRSDNISATSAALNQPSGVAVDAAGNLYIADSGNNVIRKVSNGVITTVAGNGTAGFSGDNGPATSAQLYNPDGVAVDSAGNLYIADMNNSRIRKVSNGVITTVAGTGTAGFSGDNGPVARAQLDSPDGVAVDAAGNLYIADMDNNVIRKVSNGVIYTVAGNGTAGFSGDNGPATSAQLYIPTGVAVDTAGNLYIADHQNDRIRKVSNGVITTVAGNGTLGYNGDDIPATSAALGWPYGAAVDASGDVFFSESSGLSRIRVLTPSAASCSASVAPLALSPAASGGGFSVTIQIGSSCAWVVQSLPAWITVSGSGVGAGSGSVTLSVAANTGATRTATVSIAGVSVTVTQQGLLAPLAITTSATLLSGFTAGAYSQDLAATGGSGAYTWTVASGYLPAGLAISGASITGTPTVAGAFSFTLQVADAVNDVTSQAFTLTVVGVSGSSALSRVGVLPQFAAGGSVATTIWVVNTSPTTAVPVSLVFHGDDGTLAFPVSTPLTVTQQGDTQVFTTTTLDRVLNPNTTLAINAGQNQTVNVQGWVDVLATASVGGFAIFTYAPDGLTPTGTGYATPWEATVPLQSQLDASTMTLPFINNAGFTTGIAIGSLAGSPASITATFFGLDGNPLPGSSPQSISLPANGHRAFLFDTGPTGQDWSFTSGQQGVVQFSGPALMGLGLRVSPYGTETALPTILQ